VTGVRILLDEHVGRVFERVLEERGHDVTQAKDQFGERTSDAELVAWCGEHDMVLVTNNAKDFEPLHHEYDHAGILLYYEQGLPNTDPEGLARAVDEVLNQYGLAGIEDQLVDLGEWYEWLHQ
jgi:predicted nuclease of predicted toxin-antitoxin system